MSWNRRECDEWTVPQEVRLTPPDRLDDVVAVLRAAGASAKKSGRIVLVDHDDGEPAGRLELLFFLRAWAVSHPGGAVEVVESASA